MRSTLATAIPLLLILWAGPLGAAWRTYAAGSGDASARTLGGPTAVTAVASSSSTVVVGWSAPTTGPVPDGYTVRRLAPSAGVVCAVDASTLTCVDRGLAASTSYSYTVEARLGSWSSVPSGPVAVTTPVPGPYLVSVGTGARTAGTAFIATITATTDGTTVDTTYTGTKVVSFSGPTASPSGQSPSYPTTVSFTAGVGLASITLYDAGNATLVATDGARSGSTPVVVQAGTATQLRFTSSTPSCAGGAVAVGNGGRFRSRVSQYDAYLNPVTQGGGSRTLTITRSPAIGTLNRSSLNITNGSTESSQQFQFKLPNGNPPTVTVAAAAPGLTGAGLRRQPFLTPERITTGTPGGARDDGSAPRRGHLDEPDRACLSRHVHTHTSRSRPETGTKSRSSGVVGTWNASGRWATVTVDRQGPRQRIDEAGKPWRLMRRRARRGPASTRRPGAAGKEARSATVVVGIIAVGVLVSACVPAPPPGTSSSPSGRSTR